MRVFLDHAATTPLCSAAKGASEKWLDAGNASSLYHEGRRAKAAIDEAREEVSGVLGCDFGEVIFTGSATEAASTAIIGTALAGLTGVRRKVIVSAAEHHCCLHTGDFLRALGYEQVLAPVDRFARIDLAWLAEALRENEILLVAAMHVNNELGSINPVEEISHLCRAHETLFFCDAVQSFGKIPTQVRDLGVDLLSISGHKVYGPKGVGALYVKAGTRIKPFINGGGQERELRAGTENVAAIAGLGAAARSQTKVSHTENKDRLLGQILKLGGVASLPSPISQLDSHCHVRFPGISAESLLIALDREGVSVGSGAACSSGSLEPSHVLLACGYSPAESQEGIRITLGNSTTAEEIEIALDALGTCLTRIGYKIPAGT